MRRKRKWILQFLMRKLFWKSRNRPFNNLAFANSSTKLAIIATERRHKMHTANAEEIHLDVYRDPWINAVYHNGHTEVLSMRDCFAQAMDIKFLYIEGANYALDNTVPYTLMTMMLGRIFHPKQDDKLSMLEGGSGFDMRRIDQYIEECRRSGISFDVFDKTRPFLQDPDYKKRQNPKVTQDETIQKNKNGTTTVGILDPLMVSGNNTVFYHNKNYDTDGAPVQDILFMTPPQFIVSVARNHMYHNWSGGSCSTGYTPSQPPLHCIIHGKNLFETLIISIPKNLCGLPLWERRYDMTIPEIIEQCGHLDYISAALLPTTSIRFGEIKDGTVKNIFYCGNIYKEKKKEKGGERGGKGGRKRKRRKEGGTERTSSPSPGWRRWSCRW